MQVCNDLNLRGDDTIARVGDKVNARYREVVRRLGMNVYTRVEVDIQLEGGTQDQIYDLDDPVIGRIVALYYTPDPTTSNPNPKAKMLDELTFEEMKEVVPTTDTPRRWCKVRVGSNWTQFKTDSTVPNGATLTVEGEEVPSVLEGDAEPQFESLYHDILVYGAKADELSKQKDASARAAATDWNNKFTLELNNLALKQALMAGGVIKQGKHAVVTNRLARCGPLGR